MKNIRRFAAAALCALALFGCSAKDDELYNLTPQRWFEVVLYDIQDKDLDAAGQHFVAFASEHVSSPFLERTLLLLAQAHIYEGEYVKAGAYYDDYIRRFGTRENIEYAQFLRLKAYFDVFDKPNRNQQLLAECQTRARQFLQDYPSSPYRVVVETMLTKFALGEHYLNGHIRDLYDRVGRDDAAAIYATRVNGSAFKNVTLIKPKTAWYARPFE